MYLDKENAFMINKSVSGTMDTDIVRNGNGGDAYHPLWLYLVVTSALSGPATIKLNTANEESMSGAVTVGTYTLANTAGASVAVRLPAGLKKYLRLNISGASSGKMTAVLTPDVKIG